MKRTKVLITKSYQVRTGGAVTNEEILGFAKFFNDEVTLDNISRFNLVYCVREC